MKTDRDLPGCGSSRSDSSLPRKEVLPLSDTGGHVAPDVRSGLHVLILEDGPLDAEFIQHTLRAEEHPCEFVWVQTRAEFLAALQQGSFDVILADYALPDFDGLLALALVQTLCPDTPVVMLSAMMREELIVEALRGGAADYVSKIHFSRLPYVVQRVVREGRERFARKQAEQTFTRSEQRWQMLARVSPVGIFYTDAQGRCLYVNDRWCEISGLTPEEVYPVGWEAALHPEDRSWVTTAWNRSVRELITWQAEYRFQRPDGKTTWVLGQSAPIIGSAGDMTGYVGTITDITDRKQAEAALREREEQLDLFFSQSLDGCFFMMLEESIVWDETVDKEQVLDYVFFHQRVTKANAAVGEQYGATREQALGVTPQQLRAHDLAAGRAWYRRLFDAGALQAESDDRRLDGTSFTTEGNYVCLYDVAGRITGFFGMQRDITERRQAEMVLKTLSRCLINSQEEERHRLARELHDEIGQVLTAVKLDLQAVQRDEPWLTDRLEETCEIVTHALNQVRTLARELRPPMLEHLGLVAALRWCVEGQAQRGHLHAQFAAEPFPVRPAPEVEIACFRIGQEAVTNVVRHARAQRVRVELRQEAQGRFSLSVHDDGIGFDAPMVREQAATGATLGILGMQERVRLVGGQLTIRSTPHGGTEIHARFPLQGGKET